MNEQLLDRLKARLPQYLHRLGIIESPEGNVRVAIRCINPEHNDQRPSMGFVPPGKHRGPEWSVLRCWSCQHRADIFTVAHWIEGKPSSGSEWWNDNVLYLASIFNEPVEKVELSPEEIRRHRVMSLYQDVSDCMEGLLSTAKKLDPLKLAADRGISRETCLQWIVGTFAWEEFLPTLRKYGGWEEDFIRESGISESLFGPDMITLVIRDHYGRPVAFDRRYVFFDSREEEQRKALGRPYPPKYCRTPEIPGLLLNAPMFYGIDRIATSWERADMVEGYFDVLAGWQAGHRRIFGACGTGKYRREAVAWLASEMKIRYLCLVADGDEAGRAATDKCIQECMDLPSIRIGVLCLPFDSSVSPKDRDPDNYFRQHSMEEYDKLEVITPFGFRLNSLRAEGKDIKDFVSPLITLAAHCQDSLERGRQIRELSKASGIHEEDIREEVKRITSGETEKVASDARRKLEKATSPDELRAIVDSVREKVGTFPSNKHRLQGREASLFNFAKAMGDFHSSDGAFGGFKTGIRAYDEAFGGFGKGVYTVIGGNPNSGKSATKHEIVGGLLDNITKDHAIVDFSLDDSVPYEIAKQLARKLRWEIRACANPKRSIFSDPQRTKQYNEAVEWLHSLVEESHIYFMGGDNGMTIDQIENAVCKAQDETGRHVTLVIDSFHNIVRPITAEARIGVEQLSKRLSALCNSGASVLITSECTKNSQGERPRLANLAETRAISFDADIVLMPYNELNELRQKAKFFWVCEDPTTGMMVKKPVVEMEVEKNKVTSFKERFYFKFVDHASTLEPIPDITRFMAEQRAHWSSLHGQEDLEPEIDFEE